MQALSRMDLIDIPSGVIPEEEVCLSCHKSRFQDVGIRKWVGHLQTTQKVDESVRLLDPEEEEAWEEIFIAYTHFMHKDCAKNEVFFDETCPSGDVKFRSSSILSFKEILSSKFVKHKQFIARGLAFSLLSSVMTIGKSVINGDSKVKMVIKTIEAVSISTAGNTISSFFVEFVKETGVRLSDFHCSLFYAVLPYIEMVTYAHRIPLNSFKIISLVGLGVSAGIQRCTLYAAERVNRSWANT